MPGRLSPAGSRSPEEIAKPKKKKKKKKKKNYAEKSLRISLLE